MYRHGPTCLEGPHSRANPWWVFPPNEEPALDPAAADEDEEDVRSELVERVRAELAAGTYDTPAKWEEALDRLAHRLRLA